MIHIRRLKFILGELPAIRINFHRLLLSNSALCRYDSLLILSVEVVSIRLSCFTLLLSHFTLVAGNLRSNYSFLLQFILFMDINFLVTHFCYFYSEHYWLSFLCLRIKSLVSLGPLLNYDRFFDWRTWRTWIHMSLGPPRWRKRTVIRSPYENKMESLSLDLKIHLAQLCLLYINYNENKVDIILLQFLRHFYVKIL